MLLNFVDAERNPNGVSRHPCSRSSTFLKPQPQRHPKKQLDSQNIRNGFKGFAELLWKPQESAGTQSECKRSPDGRSCSPLMLQLVLNEAQQCLAPRLSRSIATEIPPTKALPQALNPLILRTAANQLAGLDRTNHHPLDIRSC